MFYSRSLSTCNVTCSINVICISRQLAMAVPDFETGINYQFIYMLVKFNKLISIYGVVTVAECDSYNYK
jgi:hypothetical protein